MLSRFPVIEIEDNNSKDRSSKSGGAEKGVEVIDLVRLLFEVASLPAAINTEREYARKMESLEVLVKRGVLDHAHSTMLCGFCLGMLHVKFQPYWAPAVQVRSVGNCDITESFVS